MRATAASMTHASGLLAAERMRSALEQAMQERHARRLRALRRAARQERAAEQRLIEAWRRTAELQARLEFPGD
jgi:hypothetical protein